MATLARMTSITTLKNWVRFWVRFLSTFVHSHKQPRTPKLEAFRIENIRFSLEHQGGTRTPNPGSGGQRSNRFADDHYQWQEIYLFLIFIDEILQK